jgi:hypothetical protein
MSPAWGTARGRGHPSLHQKCKKIQDSLMAVFDNISDIDSFGGAPSSESDSDGETSNHSSSMEDKYEDVNYNKDVSGMTDNFFSALQTVITIPLQITRSGNKQIKQGSCSCVNPKTTSSSGNSNGYYRCKQPHRMNYITNLDT